MTNLGVSWIERWKDGKMERWKDGKMERWKDGKMERWKDKIIDFCEVTNLGGDVCVRVLASERCGFFFVMLARMWG